MYTGNIECWRLSHWKGYLLTHIWVRTDAQIKDTGRYARTLSHTQSKKRGTKAAQTKKSGCVSVKVVRKTSQHESSQAGERPVRDSSVSSSPLV